jgi:hypothetical protein
VLEDADEFSKKLVFRDPLPHKGGGVEAEMRHHLLGHVGEGFDADVYADFGSFSGFGDVEEGVLGVAVDDAEVDFLSGGRGTKERTGTRAVATRLKVAAQLVCWKQDCRNWRAMTILSR